MGLLFAKFAGKKVVAPNNHSLLPIPVFLTFNREVGTGQLSFHIYILLRVRSGHRFIFCHHSFFVMAIRAIESSLELLSVNDENNDPAGRPLNQKSKVP